MKKRNQTAASALRRRHTHPRAQPWRVNGPDQVTPRPRRRGRSAGFTHAQPGWTAEASLLEPLVQHPEAVAVPHLDIERMVAGRMPCPWAAIERQFGLIDQVP